MRTPSVVVTAMLASLLALSTAACIDWPMSGPVSQTPTGIPIAPGESIQAAVDIAPEGTRFVIKAGVHRRQSVVPKSGMTFVGERGAILDGEDATDHAFRYVDPIRPRNVTIKGLVIERYRTPGGFGAIFAINTDDWLVEDNEIRNNALAGLTLGVGMRALRNRIHQNGYVGINGYRATGALVEGNEVSFNNTSLSDPETPTGGGSGIKIAETESLTVRNNNVHDNYGLGIWMDMDCRYVIIERNTVSDNTHSGIFYEISYDGVIRHNLVQRNKTAGDPWLGSGGITVAASPNVEVYGNTVLDNGDGIVGIQTDRGHGLHGPHELQNLHVHDNIVRMLQGHTGIAQTVQDPSYFTSRNNRFERNVYYLGAVPEAFAWQDQWLTETDWRARGQDLTGKFIR